MGVFAKPPIWDVGLHLLVRWGLHGIFDFMIPQATSQPLESAERHCWTSKNVHPPLYAVISSKLASLFFVLHVFASAFVPRLNARLVWGAPLWTINGDIQMAKR
jgi:hypothetical protein